VRQNKDTMNDADRSSTYLPYLQEIAPLNELGEEPLRHIAGGSLLRPLTRGQILCEKGSRIGGFFCVISGRIKLSAVNADGGERVLDLVLPGRVFGQASTVLDQPFPVLAQALTESQVLQVGRERVREAMERWPEVALALLRSLAQDCFRLIHDLEACCLMSAGERLADFLVKESAAGPQRGDRVEVVLPVSKAVVASSLNLTPETFSRELHELVRQGLIEVDRRTVHIPSLRQLRLHLERRTGSAP
jgi:CRP/FNR family transcriptional regulator, dissimilatory nitrate respiration regulator